MAHEPCPACTSTLAVIDIGTVSTRLALAEVAPDGSVAMLERRSTITNLGEGVDATGRLDSAAIQRTCATVCDYGAVLAGRLAQGQQISAVTCTLTSAARDAQNASELTNELCAMGLIPQVIEGLVEAQLAFLGVAGDFCGQRLLVADSGGGSTELAAGRSLASGESELGKICSLDIGCRRVTERFLAPVRSFAGDRDAYIPCAEQIAEARAFAATTFAPFFADDDSGTRAFDTLACVGGTATSLVAVAHKLVPYSSEFVHLHRMGAAEVHNLACRLLALSPAQRRVLPGLQPKRADVIAAGALILDELVSAGSFDSYVASESDSLVGLLRCAYAAERGKPSPVGGAWLPALAPAREYAQSCPKRT